MREYPRIDERQIPYDRAWYTDWLRALVNTLMDNVSFDGERAVTIEQNKALKDILNSLTA